ncbi:MAG: NUDIX domain-containing protein, partial [Lachnospiraceae bacterium]|nr:NUDIX domain-containing protein [Lachnospiraceae bacterium]
MLSTTLCYIEKDGKILLLHRNKKKKDINHDKWIGVGGKFEPGETAEECLVREVFEETGLTLTGYEAAGVIKFYDNAGGDQDMYLFMGTDFTGELRTDCPE